MKYFINMYKFSANKYTLPAILLLALILRLITAISAISDGQRLLRPDSPGYLTPARTLVESGTYAGTRRPPGYPLLAAAVYYCGGSNGAIAILQVLLSTAACAVTAMAVREYTDNTACGNIAALLMAVNPTAVANAPLLLSDTLFMLFAAGQFYFFIRYLKRMKFRELAIFSVIAALAALIRPINQLIPLVAAVLIAVNDRMIWKKRITHILASCAIFAVLIFPWMLRNYLTGATFDIDTNTGAMRHQNGAMLLAEINNSDFESEKQQLLAQENTLAADGRFPDERSRESWRKQEFRRMVLAHPVRYFKQHFDICILLPDAPTLLENFGVTTSDRGTMGVLKKDGIIAACRHYFGENYLRMLLLLIPVLLPAAILYLLVLRQLFKDLQHPVKNRMELLLFLAFAEYYLFLPGAITAPRYQLPALPCLCLLGASAISSLWKNETSARDPETTPSIEM